MAVIYFGGLHRGRNFAGMLKKLTRKIGNGELQGGFCYKAGAPTTDTDFAARNGDICWDSTTSDLYMASNVDATHTTWLKFMD